MSEFRLRPARPSSPHHAHAHPRAHSPSPPSASPAPSPHSHHPHRDPHRHSYPHHERDTLPPMQHSDSPAHNPHSNDHSPTERSQRPWSPPVLNDINLNPGPSPQSRRFPYPAPPTGHELMKLFPPAAPRVPPMPNSPSAHAPGGHHQSNGGMGVGAPVGMGMAQVPSPMSTSGFFAKQERAFFAQPAPRKVRGQASAGGNGAASGHGPSPSSSTTNSTPAVLPHAHLMKDSISSASTTPSSASPRPSARGPSKISASSSRRMSVDRSLSPHHSPYPPQNPRHASTSTLNIPGPPQSTTPPASLSTASTLASASPTGMTNTVPVVPMPVGVYGLQQPPMHGYAPMNSLQPPPVYGHGQMQAHQHPQQLPYPHQQQHQHQQTPPPPPHHHHHAYAQGAPQPHHHSQSHSRSHSQASPTSTSGASPSASASTSTHPQQPHSHASPPPPSPHPDSSQHGEDPYANDPDEAWRKPMPYAERRRAGKHTKRVVRGRAGYE